MNAVPSLGRFLLLSSFLFVAACQDSTTTIPVSPPDDFQAFASPQAVAALFDRVSPEVMALPQTVFAARDEAAGQLVFGVERQAAAEAVHTVMERRGIPASAYRVEVTEPIHFLDEKTLQTEHRPTMGGTQIHFGQYVCTLGFSVDHEEGRSFITNSHCTDRQGENSGTVYYQPLSSVNPTPIGVEADDPPYLRGQPVNECSRNKRCRYSDAARVAYDSGVESLGEIARTNGLNDGSLVLDGSFDVTDQDDSSTSFSGTLHKVGRTTGWTTGEVNGTCATVNVSGSNIQLLCQTLVHSESATIAAGGDSGSPVFEDSGDGTAKLVGILWGGSASGDRFVFSPLKNIQDELGELDARSDGTSGPPVEEETGSITGTVTDADGGAAISSATVAVDGTSISTTTDASGDYTLTGVPEGTHSVTASADGYDPETKTGVEVTANAATTANFALVADSEEPDPDPDPTDGTVSVATIDYSTHGGRTSDRHLTVTVSLIDDSGDPVAGASVSIDLLRNEASYATATETTGSAGMASFSFNNYPSGEDETEVTGVSADDLEWDGVTPPNSHVK